MARALLQTAIPATGARCPARSARVSRVVRAAARRSSDSSDAALGRRDAVVGAGALLMLTTRVAPATAEGEAPDAAPEAGPEAPAVPKYGKPRVVITGSNSGIGFDAAKKLAKSGDWCVVLACRTVAKAEQAKASMRSEFPSIDPNDVQCYACDLGDMASIRQFAKDVTAEGPVDALCLNAGLEYSGDPTVYRTKDGFEETIGVNHLGHFLLANLLLPALESSEKLAHPRIVVTASEVHDPASAGGSVGKGATLGDLAGLERDGRNFEMVSGEPYDADKAYKDSKLCNMLFSYELERRLQAGGSKVTVNAFGPGLITRTGLFRHQQPLFVKAFDLITNTFNVAESVDGGGNTLLYMLTDESLEGVGGAYYSNTISPGSSPTGHAFIVQESSEESKDATEARNLWRLSEKLVGLA
mmetsp:Transcript_7482/g.30295  ORF Transcript_7482/g.30295 Transcript_7482/m.30295 type:complete len:414 (-) Transcript_7482:3047-4288(-)